MSRLEFITNKRKRQEVTPWEFKFKVGDKIKLVHKPSAAAYHLKVGDIVTITGRSIIEKQIIYNFKTTWTKNLNDNDDGWGAVEKNFELVTAEEEGQEGSNSWGDTMNRVLGQVESRLGISISTSPQEHNLESSLQTMTDDLSSVFSGRAVTEETPNLIRARVELSLRLLQSQGVIQNWSDINISISQERQSIPIHAFREIGAVGFAHGSTSTWADITFDYHAPYTIHYTTHNIRIGLR